MEYMDHSSRLSSPKLSENHLYFVNKMKDLDNRVHVKMFKKNQIGGTREIMILDFVSRCLVRTLEDISRGLAQLCDIDMLTKPKVKHKLNRDHMKLSKENDLNYTKRYSLDKTTWCQRFVNPVFYTLLSTLLPKYKEFFRYIFNCHTRKIIELPSALMKSFIQSQNSDMSDYDVNELWLEFKGIQEEYLIGERGPVIHNVSNMMQGILHYTSTVLHCAYMYYLKSEIIRLTEKVNTMSELPLRVISGMQVSSDDSGILLTVLAQPGTSKKHINLIFTGFEAIMDSTEAAFCMKTSIEKSTMSTLPLYEFNSVFHSGNNLASPLIKFVSRVCDDQVSDSLKSRVDSMHSSLREVRSNGGSGALCSSLSALQHLSLMNSFGLQIMDFFSEYSSPIYESKLSIFGFYRIMPPMLAGIFNSDFSDYISCKTNKLALHMMNVTRRLPSLSSESESVDKLVYRMWPTRRYNAALEKMGIDRSEVLNYGFESLKVLLQPPDTIDEATDRVKISLSAHSSSRAFATLCRTDNQFSQAYLLWDKIFRVGGELLALDEYRDLLKTTETKSTLDIFPLRDEYNYYLRLIEKPLVITDTKVTYILSHQGYAAMHSALPSLREINNLLLTDWYGVSTFRGKQMLNARQKIKKLFPWYSEDRYESLRASGLQTPLQLINFMCSYSDTSWGFNFIAAGHSKLFRNIIEGLAPLNTFRHHHIGIVGLKGYLVKPALRDRTTHEMRSEVMKAFENRITDWNTLMGLIKTNGNTMYLENVINDDMNELSDLYAYDLESPSSNPHDAMLQHALQWKKDDIEFYRALSNVVRPQILYRIPQVKVDGQWSGHGELLYHTASGTSLITIKDSHIVRQVTTSSTHDLTRMMDQLHLTLHSDFSQEVRPIESIVKLPSRYGFYRSMYNVSLALFDINGKPVLRLDSRVRTSSFSLTTNHIRSKTLRNWHTRETDEKKWAVGLLGESISRDIMLEALANAIEQIRIVDPRVIGHYVDPVADNNWFRRNEEQTQDDWDDMLFELAGNFNQEELVEGEEPTLDWEDYLEDVDVTIFHASDAGKMVHHPFIQFFSTSMGRLPGIMGTIQLYHRYLRLGDLGDETIKEQHALGILTEEYLQKLKRPDFSAYISDTLTRLKRNVDEDLDSDEEAEMERIMARAASRGN
jgi:hypothetical protein